MSFKARRVVAALTWGLWLWWVVTYAAAKIHDVGVLHLVVMEVVRNAAMMMTISFIMGCLVGPMVATARVWHRIGVQEQQKRCTCSTGRAAKMSNLIPVNFNGSIPRIGEAVRNRDN